MPQEENRADMTEKDGRTRYIVACTHDRERERERLEREIRVCEVEKERLKPA